MDSRILMTAGPAQNTGNSRSALRPCARGRHQGGRDKANEISTTVSLYTSPKVTDLY